MCSRFCFGKVVSVIVYFILSFSLFISFRNVNIYFILSSSLFISNALIWLLILFSYFTLFFSSLFILLSTFSISQASLRVVGYQVNTRLLMWFLLGKFAEVVLVYCYSTVNFDLKFENTYCVRVKIRNYRVRSLLVKSCVVVCHILLLKIRSCHEVKNIKKSRSL